MIGAAFPTWTATATLCNRQVVASVTHQSLMPLHRTVHFMLSTVCQISDSTMVIVTTSVSAITETDVCHFAACNDAMRHIHYVLRVFLALDCTALQG